MGVTTTVGREVDQRWASGRRRRGQERMRRQPGGFGVVLATVALLAPLASAAEDAGVPPGEPAVSAAPKLAAERVAAGDRLMKERQYRDAAFAYLDAVHADPGSVEAAFKLGNAYGVLGYYEHAVAQWERAASLSSDAAVRRSAQDNIARARQKAAAEGGATPQLRGSRPGQGPVSEASREKARAAYERGVAQVNAREYQEAIATLTGASTLDPSMPAAFVARGSAYIGARRYADALIDYQHAQRLAPGWSAPLYGLAEAYRALGRYPEARAHYRRYAASQAPDVRPELQEDARRKLQRL